MRATERHKNTFKTYKKEQRLILHSKGFNQKKKENTIAFQGSFLEREKDILKG